MLFNCFISHGYLPRDFMKTTIVPIIKNKSGNCSDKAIYGPIALATACYKIFESCLLRMLEKYLHPHFIIYLLTTFIHTHDQHFGFKSQHTADRCIFTVKGVIKYYTRQNSTGYTCFLDAAKALDRMRHWIMFSKMIKRNVPLVILQIIAYWCQTRPMCVKWGKVNSVYFNPGTPHGTYMSHVFFLHLLH